MPFFPALPTFPTRAAAGSPAARRSPFPAALCAAAFSVGAAAENLLAMDTQSQITWSLEAAGVSLSSDLIGFPLLLRLGSEQGALFQSAAIDGSDLRIRKADGATLPAQIESWDAAEQVAAVWVRIDTVHASDPQTPLLLTTGALSASGGADPTSPQAGAAVFAPVSGFAGVWHMEGEGRDATAQAPAAKDSGTSAVEGVAGGARGFNNPDSYAVSGAFMNLGNPQSLDLSGVITMEAWVRWRSKANHRVIVCHGQGGGNTTETVLRVGEYQDYRTGIWNGAVHHAHADAAAGDSAVWIHLAGTYDGTSWRLYRNGQSVDDTVDAVGAQKSPAAWRIGAQSTGAATSRYFHGDIDEVRLSRVARPQAYFRLGYETQKPGSTVVRVGSTAVVDAVFAPKMKPLGGAHPLGLPAGGLGHSPRRGQITPLGRILTP